MVYNKFFNTVFDESEGHFVRVEPSEYVQMMHPHKAMEELKGFINSLKDELSHYTGDDMQMGKDFGKVRNMAFELHLAQAYLSHLRESYTTIH